MTATGITIDSIARGAVMRALNTTTADIAARWEAWIIYDRDGLEAALAYCKTLPQVTR